MAAFLQSFIWYLGVMIVLCIIGFLGGFIGTKLRKHKDAKTAAQLAAGDLRDTAIEAATEAVDAAIETAVDAASGM